MGKRDVLITLGPSVKANPQLGGRRQRVRPTLMAVITSISLDRSYEFS